MSLKPQEGDGVENSQSVTDIILYNISRVVPDLTVYSSGDPTADATECAYQGCETDTRRALTREFVVEDARGVQANEDLDTEERLVCARHFYLEQAAREMIWWVGFAIFCMLMLPSVSRWSVWGVLFG